MTNDEGCSNHVMRSEIEMKKIDTLKECEQGMIKGRDRVEMDCSWAIEGALDGEEESDTVLER